MNKEPYRVFIFNKMFWLTEQQLWRLKQEFDDRKIKVEHKTFADLITEYRGYILAKGDRVPKRVRDQQRNWWGPNKAW